MSKIKIDTKKSYIQYVESVSLWIESDREINDLDLWRENWERTTIGIYIYNYRIGTDQMRGCVMYEMDDGDACLNYYYIVNCFIPITTFQLNSMV